MFNLKAAERICVGDVVMLTKKRKVRKWKKSLPIGVAVKHFEKGDTIVFDPCNNTADIHVRSIWTIEEVEAMGFTMTVTKPKGKRDGDRNH